MQSSRLLKAAVLAVAMLAAGAQADPALAAAKTAAPVGTTITDPLTGGTTLASRIAGGRFTAEGWQVTDPAKGNKIGQHLLYILPEGSMSGTIEFEAKGFATNKYPADTDNREHVWGVFDQDVPHDMPSSGTTGWMLRLYDHQTPTGTFLPGSHRFRFNSPATRDKDVNKKAAVAWDPNIWYTFKFQWFQTSAKWFKDGVLQSSLRVPSQNKPLRYLYLGSDYRKVGLIPNNVTYRNVKITSNVAGTWGTPAQKPTPVPQP